MTDILTAIPLGHDNAKTKREIAESLNISTREFEAAVETIRKSGTAAICSDAHGYWRPLTVEEYEANLANRRKRALNQLVTNRGERRCAKAWKARESLPLAMPWAASEAA